MLKPEVQALASVATSANPLRVPVATSLQGGYEVFN